MKILEIESGSIAEEIGIKAGAELISVNNKKIADMLAYRFHCSGDMLELLVEQDGKKIIVEIEKEPHEDIGLILENLIMRKCGNKCVFCFVHQNPKGLRRSLYFKDEDYRFSFLYGHYVTLTNAAQTDLDRIVEQRLTPLYISVHATDPELRKYILGIKSDDKLIQKIRYLTDNGIELHCQIVICPGLNDGAQLDKTIADLKRFYPRVKSIAIVPVGLTKHRKNLPIIKQVSHEYSLKLMDEISQRRKKLCHELGSSFVYLSDEFYIKTGVPIPDNDYYEGFYQLENGVGLTRDFIDRFYEERKQLPQLTTELHLSLVSGVLGYAVLERYIVDFLRSIPNLKLSLHQVINIFFGESIVVAGLLVGQDIFRSLKEKELGDYVILPPRVLNHDNLFLDDWTLDELEERLNTKVMIFPDSFSSLFDHIAAERSVASEKESKRIRHSAPDWYITEPVKGG